MENHDATQGTIVMGLAVAAFAVSITSSGCVTARGSEPSQPDTRHEAIEVELKHAMRFASGDEFSRRRVVDNQRIPHVMVRADTSARLVLTDGPRTAWYGPGFTLRREEDVVIIADRNSSRTVAVSSVDLVVLRGRTYEPNTAMVGACVGLGAVVGALIYGLRGFPGPR